MGNERSRNLSRPADRGRRCVCDVFDLTAAVDGDALVLTLDTDLPAGTRVTVAGHRLMAEADGHAWQWTCIDEASAPVTERADGGTGFVLRFTADELDATGLSQYRQLRRSTGVVIAGPPTPRIEVAVAALTSPHRFGLCNRRLTGKAVIVRPSDHRLERTAFAVLPVSAAALKTLGI